MKKYIRRQFHDHSTHLDHIPIRINYRKEIAYPMPSDRFGWQRSSDFAVEDRSCGCEYALDSRFHLQSNVSEDFPHMFSQMSFDGGAVRGGQKGIKSLIVQLLIQNREANIGAD